MFIRVHNACRAIGRLYVQKRGAANFMELIVKATVRKEKRCNPLAALRLFILQFQLFLGCTDRK
jgi:hypothetical protein